MHELMLFYGNSVLLGVGLAMDAFSVSIGNGLNEPKMRRKRMVMIAGTFGGFQLLMPLIGWILVYTGVQYFSVLEKFIPWIALILLSIIGGKMLVEGIKNEAEEEVEVVGMMALFAQGIATSIDALSVGFTIVGYSVPRVVICCLIIGVVTFVICMFGLKVGKKFGMLFANKAMILGGAILIFIGMEVFIKGVIS